jgi:hypothetical protein
MINNGRVVRQAKRVRTVGLDEIVEDVSQRKRKSKQASEQSAFGVFKAFIGHANDVTRHDGTDIIYPDPFVDVQSFPAELVTKELFGKYTNFLMLKKIRWETASAYRYLSRVRRAKLPCRAGDKGIIW